MVKGLFRITGWSLIGLASAMLAVQYAFPLCLQFLPSLPKQLLHYSPLVVDYKSVDIQWGGVRPSIVFENVYLAPKNKTWDPIRINSVRLDVLPRYHTKQNRVILFDNIQIEGVKAVLPQMSHNAGQIKRRSFNYFEKARIRGVELAIPQKESANVIAHFNATITSYDQDWHAHIQSSSLGLDIHARGGFAKSLNRNTFVQIYGQDLGLLKPFLPSPWFDAKGTYNIELWHTNNVEDKNNLTIKTHIENFSAKIKKETLHCQHLELTSFAHIGKDKLDIYMDSLSTSGLMLNSHTLAPLRANKITYQKKARELSVQLNDIDAELLNPYLSLFQAPEDIQQINFVTGEFKNNLITLSVANQKVKLSHVVGEFNDLLLETKDYQLEHTSGSYHITPDISYVDIQNAAFYSDSKLLNNFDSIDKAQGRLYWQLKPELTFWTEGISLVSGDFGIAFSGSLHNLHNPQLEALMGFSSFNIEQFRTLDLTGLVPSKLNTWFESALQAGEFYDIRAAIKTPLNNIANVLTQEAFSLEAKFKNVDLAYAPEWPELNQGSGLLQLDQDTLHIWADSATIMGITTQDVNTTISDVTGDPSVRVVTNFTSDFNQGIHFIENSPLKDKFAQSLEYVELHGPMDLHLDLTLPLKHKEDLDLTGFIQTSKTNIDVPKWQIPIRAVTGKVHFTQDKIYADNLQGQLWGRAHEFSLKSAAHVAEPWVEINTRGQIDVPTLNRWLGLGKNTIAEGKASYEAAFRFGTDTQHQQGHLLVRSDLRGIKVNAPAPWGKSAPESSYVDLSLYFEPNELMRIKSNFDEEIDLAMSFNTAANRWSFLGGHIHFGENTRAGFREDRYLLIDGKVDHFNVNEWQPFLVEFKQLWPVSFSPKFEIDAFVPIVDVHTNSLALYGQEYRQVDVEASWEPISNTITANFDGNDLHGVCVFKNDNVNGKLDLNFKRLHLQTNTDKHKAHVKTPPDQMYPLELHVKNLTVDEKQFSNVIILGLPADHGYHFSKIKANMMGGKIDMFGDWYRNQTPEKFNVGGRIRVNNSTDFLKSLGKKGTIYGANGNIVMNVDWQGTPFSLDINSLNGRAHIDLNDGIIQGVNPGFGRILSLLNLDNMHKRLTLDFSDVTGSGFDFDIVKASIMLEDGKARSSRVIIDGPTAKIEALGNVDLKTSNLNAQIVVMPNVTGSLPLAAAIAAANPAVGAGVWLVDKIFGKQIQEISRYKYNLSGTWDSPRVQDSTSMARKGK